MATGVADANLPLTLGGIPLGVLDLAPVPDGGTTGDALRATIDLAKTHDGGKTWQSISAALPAGSPVNAVREDTERKGMLFAATETAVWVSRDDGDHWESLQINLPHTSMRDLAIQGSFGAHEKQRERQLHPVHRKPALARPHPSILTSTFRFHDGKMG